MELPPSSEKVKSTQERIESIVSVMKNELAFMPTIRETIALQKYMEENNISYFEKGKFDDIKQEVLEEWVVEELGEMIFGKKIVNLKSFMGEVNKSIDSLKMEDKEHTWRRIREVFTSRIVVLYEFEKNCEDYNENRIYFRYVRFVISDFFQPHSKKEKELEGLMETIKKEIVTKL